MVVILALLACHGSLTRESTPVPDTGVAPDTGDSAAADTAETATETGDTAPPPIDADADGSPLPVDCDDSRADVYPGATEVCDHVDHDCDGVLECSVSDSWAVVQDVPSRYLTVRAGDLTGDGVEELLVADNQFLYDYGVRSAEVLDPSRVVAGVQAISDVRVVAVRSSVLCQPVGDVDGDGLADLGLAGYDYYTDWSGDWGVWYNDGVWDGRELSASDASDELLSAHDLGSAYGLWPRDIDGDGVAEVLTEWEPGDGTMTFSFMPPAALHNGALFTDYAGFETDWWQVGDAGDVDGDGLGDVWYDEWSPGIVLGNDLQGDSRYARAELPGPIARCDPPDTYGGEDYGHLAGVGDVNQDGLDDVSFGCESRYDTIYLLTGVALGQSSSAVDAWVTLTEAYGTRPFLDRPGEVLVDGPERSLEVYSFVVGGGVFAPSDADARLDGVLCGDQETFRGIVGHDHPDLLGWPGCRAELNIYSGVDIFP